MSSVNNRSNLDKYVSPEDTLLRMSLACMLWEDQFYLDGISQADMLTSLVPKCKVSFVEDLARTARNDFKLRHLPLFLLRELARHGKLSAQALFDVIQRPDELGEFLSIYWKDGKTPISNQVKKGLAMALGKFNEYQLAKFDKNSAKVSIRDVLFLTHAKPKDVAQEALFAKIAANALDTPVTWETELSAGADKAETFRRLMRENKLGALAFLRNLRNMLNAGVSVSEIRAYGAKVDTTKVLPFRYLAAARIVPQLEDMLDSMMLSSMANTEKLPGKTILLVDISGSMFGAKVSAKSDLDRFDAACALAVICREVCEDVELYTFADRGPVRVPPRRGMALIDALRTSQPHGGTNTGLAVKTINSSGRYDRLIVFTDEQSHDVVPSPKGTGYMINVASYSTRGVGIKHGWNGITGFSEAVVSYIQAVESN